MLTLTSRLTGNQAEFIINNTKAGPGSLGVTIEGPSKVKMECQECPEGFKVHYTPMAPGNYIITIKYGGPNHISGSPFKARVTGERAGLIGAEVIWLCVMVFGDDCVVFRAAAGERDERQ